MSLASVGKILIWIIAIALVAVGLVLYRSRQQRPDLRNVEPHAREEIEKALRH